MSATASRPSVAYTASFTRRRFFLWGRFTSMVLRGASKEGRFTSAVGRGASVEVRFTSIEGCLTSIIEGCLTSAETLPVRDAPQQPPYHGPPPPRPPVFRPFRPETPRHTPPRCPFPKTEIPISK